MKRFMLFFVLCSALLIACEPITPNGDQYPVVSADDYYWYNGEKIYLERGNQEYIIYDDALLSEIDKEKLESSQSVLEYEEPNLKWGTTKPNIVIEDLDHVLYRTLPTSMEKLTCLLHTLSMSSLRIVMTYLSCKIWQSNTMRK